MIEIKLWGNKEDGWAIKEGFQKDFYRFIKETQEDLIALKEKIHKLELENAELIGRVKTLMSARLRGKTKW